MSAVEILHTVADLGGFIVGAALALLGVFGVITVADALWEWLLERCIDPLRAGREDVSILHGGPQDVLVSDLHIDTWGITADGDLGARGRAFEAFLATLGASPAVGGFILNGDLMDVPVFAGSFAPGTEDLLLPVGGPVPSDLGLLDPRYDPLLRLLAALKAGTDAPQGISRVIFQTGNHDMGMQGIRFIRDRLPGVEIVWNPQIVLQSGPRRHPHFPHWVYIEHGHYYDPFLWLYARYALLDITRGGNLQRDAVFLRGMQRNGVRGMGRHAHLGPHSPQEEATPATPEPPRDPDARWDFADAAHSFTEWIVILRFRLAARRAFRALQRGAKPGGGRAARQPAMAGVRTVTFGHTHLPDRYVFPGGLVYVNSGDWCGNTPHQCYCLVQRDGTVLGPFQWRDARQAVERHHW